MKEKCVSELKGGHSGTDIYVVGSGPSLTFIDPAFFRNKIVVCINFTIEKIKVAESLYLVAKEPPKPMQDAAVQRNAKIVMCRHHSGLEKSPLNKICYPESTYIFTPKQGIIHRKNDKTNALERSSSTLVTGLHLAAYMGAKNIILIGHDCGKVDNEMHVKDYNKQNAVMKGRAYVKWMKSAKVEIKTIDAKRKLKQHWKVNVYSLNPFINFGLEGHKYERFR